MVFIDSVKIKNFKKITNKTISFEKMNIMSNPNGYGKTTIIQAIIWCIYGKAPSRNLKSLRPINKEVSETSVTVSCKTDKRPITITRVLDSDLNSHIYIDGTQYSKKDIQDEINSIFGPIEFVYFQDNLNTLSVASFSFIKKQIDEDLKEVLEFQDYVKDRKYRTKCYIKPQEYNIASVKEELENLKHEKASLEKEVQNSQYIEESKYTAALFQKDVRQNLEKLEPLPRYGREELEEIEKKIREYEVHKNRDYKEGTSRIPDEFIASAKKAHDFFAKNGYCPCCGGSEYRWETSDFISSEESSLYNKKKELCDFVQGVDHERYENSKKYYKYLSLVDESIDYEEIIRDYNKQTNNNLKLLISIEKNISILEERLNSYRKREEENMAYKKELEELELMTDSFSQYLDKCYKYVLHTTLSKTSGLVSKIFPHIINITLIDEELVVTYVENGEYMSRPLSTFSSGESSSIIVCYLISLREVFGFNSVIFLDEALGNLDTQNVSTCLNILDSKCEQVFAITHNFKREV